MTRSRAHRPDQPDPIVMTVRSPEDLIAFAPVAVGFVPDDSVVMLALRSPGGGPHARVALPPDVGSVDEVVALLLRAARLNDVELTAFLVYGQESSVTRALARRLTADFAAKGIEVCHVLRVTDDRWYDMAAVTGRAGRTGVPYDVATHRFTVQAILRGRVIRSSRRELEALVRPTEGRPLITEDLVRAARVMRPGEVAEVVQCHVDARTMLSDEDLAAVVGAVSDPCRRDECWSWLDRASARDAVDVWTDAVSRVPDSHVADVAAVLAFVAWLSGDGALAWCAVDRCREAQERNSLATLVAQLLDGSVSPDVWERPSSDLPGESPPAA